MALPQSASNTSAIELGRVSREHDIWIMEVQCWIAAAGAVSLIAIVWYGLLYVAQLRRPQCPVTRLRSGIKAMFQDFFLESRWVDTANLSHSDRMVVDIQCFLRELVWSLCFRRDWTGDGGLPLPNTRTCRWKASRRTRKYARKLRTAILVPLRILHLTIKKAVNNTKLVLSATSTATITSLTVIARPIARYVLDIRASEREFHWRIRINRNMSRLRQQFGGATKRARLRYWLDEKPPVRPRPIASHAVTPSSLAVLFGAGSPRTYYDAALQTRSPLFTALPPEVRIAIYEHIIHADLSTSRGLHVKGHHFVAPTLALTCKAIANEIRPVQLCLIEKDSDFRITWLIPDISPPSLLRLFGTLHQHHEDLLEDFYLTQSLWSDGQYRSLVRIRDMGVEICLSRKAIVQLNTMWTPKGRVPGSLRHCDRVKWASELQEPAIEVECGVWYLVRYLGWKRAMWRECRRLIGNPYFEQTDTAARNVPSHEIPFCIVSERMGASRIRANIMCRTDQLRRVRGERWCTRSLPCARTVTEYYKLGPTTTMSMRNAPKHPNEGSGTDAILLLLQCLGIVAGVALLFALPWFGLKYLMGLPRLRGLHTAQEARWRDRIQYSMRALVEDIRSRRSAGLPIDPLDIDSDVPPWSIGLRTALPRLRNLITYADADSQSASPFFARLPVEIRVLICEQVIYEELASSTGLRCKERHLIVSALARTCKQLYNEICPMQRRLADDTDCIVSWQVPRIAPSCLLALLATLKEYHEIMLEDLWAGDYALLPPGRHKVVQVKGFGVEIRLSKWGMGLLREKWTPVAGPARTLGSLDSFYWFRDVQDLGVEVDDVSAWELNSVGRTKGLRREWRETTLAGKLGAWWIGASDSQKQAGGDGEDDNSVQDRSSGRPGSEISETMTMCLGLRRRRKATWADFQRV
ncbi:hypothetical protein LTR95_011832 [Oleoguttula sp. CCFEE 5521]